MLSFRLLTGVVMLALVAGCATKKPMTPLPYRFAVAGFSDERTEGDVGNIAMMEAFPFVPGDFTQAVQRQMPSNLFGGVDATLMFVLKHYEVTQFNGMYALSMVVNVSGADAWGRPLASKDVACSEVAKEGFALDTYVQQVRLKKSLEPLTMEGRVRTMWEGMYDACVDQLVRTYAQDVLTKTLSRPYDKSAGRPERAHE